VADARFISFRPLLKLNLCGSLTIIRAKKSLKACFVLSETYELFVKNNVEAFNNIAIQFLMNDFSDLFVIKSD